MSINQQLNLLRPLYETCRSLQDEINELQTVEQAQRAYDDLFADAQVRLDALHGEKKELEAKLQKLRHTLPTIAVNLQQRSNSRRFQSPRRPFNPPARRPPPLARPQFVADRHQFKKIANRFRGLWRLDSIVLGQINEIAENQTRPFGEALILLPWSIFENPLPAREDQEKHGQRLKTWTDALQELQDVLQSRVDSLQMRYSRFQPIFNLWQSREEAHGRAAWDEFIAGRRNVIAAEITALEAEVARLRADLEAEK